MSITQSKFSFGGNNMNKLLLRTKTNPDNDVVQTRQIKTFRFGILCYRKKPTKQKRINAS